MKTWAEFLPRMTLHLPGSPEFVITDALRDAAIDFFGRTRIWCERGVKLCTTKAGVADYAVTSNPVEAGLSHLHAAWLGEREIEVAHPGEDAGTSPGATDHRFRIELAGRAAVRLIPAPERGDEQVIGTVSYQPTDIAIGIASRFYYEWREAIEKRALAELMGQPNKPWSSQMAPVHALRYEELVQEAANLAGPVRRRPLRVRMW